MTLPGTDISRIEAEQFIYAEARLADDHRYDDWEALWTDDGLYWIPAGSGSAESPDTHISVIYDNRSRIALRVAQLKTGKRHSQDPVSGVAHLISNVEVMRNDPHSTETRASFIVVESRSRGMTTWAGTVHHTLTRVGTDVRMSRKVVTLVNRDQPISTYLSSSNMIIEHVIENEFASVTVSIDRRGNDDRLLIVDNKTGQRACYDALLLESLAWIPEQLLKRLLDPSLHRWSAESEPPGAVSRSVS